MERVLNLYKASLQGKLINGTTIEVNTTILNKYTYVYQGTTHVVFELNNTTVHFAEATPETVNISDWYEILTAKPGDFVSVVVVLKEDKWVIIRFDILVTATSLFSVS